VDIRVKERLTGAVILVALIVLVVPELLSGPARRAVQPAATAGEAPLRSVTVQLGDEARSSDAEDLAAPARSIPAPAAEESPAAQSSSASAQGSGPMARQAAQQVASAQSESAAPAAAQPPPDGETVHAARSGRNVQPAQAQRVARAGHDATPSLDGAHARSPASPGWWVQVGSFESRERADRFVHRLKMVGFAAFVSESVSHGRKWYRVRVGPERDRVAARAMVVRLHSAGHGGSIIPP
jgi:DedD protein